MLVIEINVSVAETYADGLSGYLWISQLSMEGLSNIFLLFTSF